MSVDLRSALKGAGPHRKAEGNSPRVLLLSSCFLVMMFSWGSTGTTAPRLVALIAAAGLTGVALLSPRIVNNLDRLRRTEQAMVVILLLLGLKVTAGMLAGAVADLGSPLWVAVVSSYMILGLTGALQLVRRRSELKWAFWLFLAIHAVLTVVFLRATPFGIDVEMFLREGAVNLLHGHNPYAMTYPDLYPADKTKLFYGNGVVVNGRITFGVPYPPIALLVAIPGQLMGDVRYSQLIAMLVTALVLHRLASDSLGRAVAVLGVAAPAAIATLTGSWTEPTLVALLACLVFALERRWQASLAVFLGLFVVSKQYVVVAVPIIWLIRRSLTRRVTLIGLSVATAVTLPFFLADPAAFWKAIVEFQLIQPFRADSLSLLVSSVNTFGWPPHWTYGVLPLAGGGLTAVALAVRAPRTPAAFAAGVGLAMLVTILLSKQAFMNYYYLVSGAFLIAAVAWPTKPEPVTVAPVTAPSASVNQA